VILITEHLPAPDRKKTAAGEAWRSGKKIGGDD